MGGCLLRLTQMWSAVERKRRDIQYLWAGERRRFRTESSFHFFLVRQQQKGGMEEGGRAITYGSCRGKRERGLLAPQGERGASKRKAMAQTEGGREGRENR